MTDEYAWLNAALERVGVEANTRPPANSITAKQFSEMRGCSVATAHRILTLATERGEMARTKYAGAFHYHEAEK